MKLTCREVLDQLAEYLDDEARQELVRQVNLHVGSCQHCRIEVDTLKRTIQIFQYNEEVVLPARLDERLRSALEQAYRAGASEPDPEQGEA
jgi:hypothetical protein